MTDIVYGIRLQGDATSAKRAFEDTRGAQDKLTRAERDNTRAAVEVERANERRRASLNSLRLAALAAGAATLLMMRQSVAAAIEAERAQFRLSAALRATGGISGVTRREIEQLAGSMAESTIFDDEDVRNAVSELVKFGNIHGQVFRDALSVSADLASFMGEDLAQAAHLVGRVMQSPTQGIEALQERIGYLTQAERDHINTLVLQGRAVEAQGAALDLLRRKVSGAAEEINQGLIKATGDLSKEWGELLETLGKEGTIFNNTLGGATALIRDVRLELQGTRTPLQDLAEDSLEWLSVLRFLPGAISMIGTAARNAQLEMDRQRRTVSGRIRNSALEDVTSFEASLASTPAVPITLGGKPAAAEAREAAEREREKARAQTAADYAESLAMQQEILDEARALGVAFLQQQDEKRLALEKEGEAVRDVLDPWNAYAREVERLRGLLDKGVISQREFGEAVALEARKVAGAFETMADAGTQSFDELKQAIEGWGQDLSRELARGEVGLRSIAGLFEELLAMQLHKRAIQPFLRAGTSFLDDLFAGSSADAYLGNAAPFHSGGIVGLEGGARRFVHPAHFQGAPRLHAGGLAGGEVPAILSRGEGVFTPEQMRAMGSGNVSIKVINETGVPDVRGQVSNPRIDAGGLAFDLLLHRLSIDASARQQLRGFLGQPNH